MLEFIILIVLTVRIVRYSKLRGQSPLKWGALLWLNWFMFELLGVAMATSLLNIKIQVSFTEINKDMLLLSIFGIGCGFLGYFMTRRMLDRSVV